MSAIKKLKDSFSEMKNIHSLTAVAMLLALRVVQGMFANATLPFFGNNVKLSGAFLPIAVAGSMFGPVAGAVVGAFGDIISFIIVPTGAPYFPGFTISGLLTGLIYGFAFYKNKVTVPRTIIAWAVNMILVETFLAAFWLYVLQGASSSGVYLTILGARFISVALKCIPEILLIFAVGKLAAKIKIPKRLKA